VREGFIARFVILVLGIFIIFTVLSGAYLYVNMYKPLGSDYSASVSTMAELKDTLLAKSIKIYAFFFIFILSGTIVLGVLYTHRIAGPMYRIKLFARTVAEGSLDKSIHFRKKDVIHSLAYTLNKMSERFRERIGDLDSDLNDLENAINDLKSSGSQRETESIIHRISAMNIKIKNSLEEIKT
jgi:methyl-accepting chemotaxis protein